VSHAILAHNRGRDARRADGIVVTPSHNPPDNGGFKYNTPDGGPADTTVTSWIETRANVLLAGALKELRRVSFQEARHAATTHEYDFLSAYVNDLGQVFDFEAIRASNVRMGVDPLGGAGVHYWARIADRYKLDLTVVSTEVDPRFGFMTLDWDGRIRMDPSSPYAMQRLIGLPSRYDIAFACDTDHDRHGIVTRSGGLLQPNHYLSVLADYLSDSGPAGGRTPRVGKTLVSTALLDRVAARHGARAVKVGFKWFVEGLLEGAGLRMRGKRRRLIRPWTAESGLRTKDGVRACPVIR
jgi:phosphoglucomutase